MLAQIADQHREIMRMRALAMPVTQIADALGMTERNVQYVVNSPLFKAEMEKRFHTPADEATFVAMEELKALQEDAVIALADTVRQTDYPTLRFHAARDILNRTGIATPHRVEVDKRTLTYEEHLLLVRSKYDSGNGNSEPTPIQVIGGVELLVDEDEASDE